MTLLILVFFLSGAAALLFETLWFHQLGLVLGNSVWASSLVLAGFMGGLALGNGLAGRLGHRVRRRVRLYGGLELVVGASGLWLVYALPQLAPLLAPLLRPLADLPWLIALLRLLIAFALLLLPSTAMGATLPLLVAALSRRDPRFGRVLGRLYGWNTLGAVAGAVSGQALLIGWLGIRGAGWVAALANATAAAVAFALARGLDAAAPPASRAATLPALPRSAGALLGGTALSGATLLALEVVWFRFLTLFVLPGSLAFALMLAVVLTGIGLGGLVAGFWLGRDAESPLRLPWLCLGAGALCIASYAGFGLVIPHYADDAIHRARDTLAVALPLMLPLSFCSGLLFTGFGDALQRLAPAATRSVGFITLANTAGAMLGALAGGFLLLPGLGIERSIQLLAASYAVTAVLAALPFARRRQGRVAALAVALALLVAGAALLPRGLMRERYLAIPLARFAERDGSAPVAIREGLTETILFLRRSLYGEPLYYRLVTNAHSMSSTHLQSRRYMKLFVHLPVALHPEPRRALLISYGLGLTAKALTDTRSLEEIVVVDVSRDILGLDYFVYPDPAERPLSDPRVVVHIEDGRHFLQTSEARFDIITAEPPPPKAAGIVNLFTREFFSLLRSRLAQGGIATYWLPVHSLYERETRAIIRAFCDAFDDCTLWSGADLDWMLVGSRDARGPVSAAQFSAQWRDPVVGRELRELGVELPEQLGALFIAGTPWLRALTRDTPPVDDDHPERIGRDPVQPARVRPRYRLWLEPESSRGRFEADAWVARLWPAELRLASSEFFQHRPLLDAAPRAPAPTLRSVHELQTRSPLRTLVHWQLNGSADTLRAARRAWSRGRRGPALDLEFGAAALAERDYLEAARRFQAAEQAGPQRRRFLYQRLYALCMAGRLDEARALAEGAGLPDDRHPQDRAVRDFLFETFPLDGAGSTSPQSGSARRSARLRLAAAMPASPPAKSTALPGSGTGASGPVPGVGAARTTKSARLSSLSTLAKRRARLDPAGGSGAGAPSPAKTSPGAKSP